MAVSLAGARKPPPRMPGFTPYKPLPTGGGYPAGAQPYGARPKTPAAARPGPLITGTAPPPPMSTVRPTTVAAGGGFFNQGGGGNPYAGLIGGDYGVAEMESLMNARMGRARGDFQSQLRQALIDLGVTDTSKLGSLGKYIDAATIKNAAANKYSQMAQVEQQQTAQQAQSQAALAARGMLSSGQTTSDAEKIIAQGEQTRYGALRDFLSGGAQGLTQLADLNDEMAMQLAQARADAAARAAETYGWLGYGGPNAYDPASVINSLGGASGIISHIPSVPGVPGVPNGPWGPRGPMDYVPGPGV